MKNCRLVRWIKEIWLWLAEGKIIFLCIFIIIVVLTPGFIIGYSEDNLRIAGYVLQLVGMFFAVLGLLRVRKHFGQPALFNLLLDWLKRFPKWRRDQVIGVGAIHSSTAVFDAQVEVWATDDPTLTTEKRIEAILKNLDRIRIVQKEHIGSIADLKRSHESHKKEVTEKHETLKEDLHSDRVSLHTGDLMTSLVGLVWLTVGITMSTLAPELSELAKLFQ